MKTLVILGAGGHGLVVSEAAMLMQVWDKIYFMDQKHAVGSSVHSLEVISPQQLTEMDSAITDIVIAVGDNTSRLALMMKYIELGYQAPVILHPRACVSTSAKIAAGSVVLANAVINAKSQLGVACIINSAAVIEHECILADAVHVSPNACLAGNVTVGTCSWIGAGAVVINNKNIDRDVMVGAGAVVIKDLTAEQCVVGVPAKQKSF